ncbi:MAG TPA: tRNA (N(6)-L-threonylcarbamoyladenosine(37)-C(2))-methylthiotransferase [Methanobacteriaceae archaeon]|nr:tRNA (N(6)-L-threonylcarbamoyladenosine(37)-C(2))-methylthiotransferase [Methanobacteriaceae archaeon]
MKIYLETFGCTFNQADSQIMVASLKKAGHELVQLQDDADVVILNSCYVKLPTEQKITNRIKMADSLYPQKKLVVAGCMVDIDPEKLDRIAPNASWIGARQINSTLEVVEAAFNGEIKRKTGHSCEIKAGLPKKRFNPLIHVLQIAEGCQGICTYCCTRLARGPLQSYPKTVITLEAEQAVKEGCVELQLTAQDTAAYGKDTGDKLSPLIDTITSIKGNFRVRVGMMHPQSVNDDLESLIESFKNEKVYKFLHLPIQTGSNQVLKDMNRGYTTMDFKEIVDKFRQKIPELSLATDVIVGYPTEDDSAFHDTLNLINDIKPDFLHISKYQHRPGAISSKLEEIDHQTMKNRSRELNELKSKIAYQKNQKLLNTIQNILITDKGPKGGFVGRSSSYKTIIVDRAPLGEFLPVKITEAKSTYLRGELI